MRRIAVEAFGVLAAIALAVAVSATAHAQSGAGVAPAEKAGAARAAQSGVEGAPAAQSGAGAAPVTESGPAATPVAQSDGGVAREAGAEAKAEAKASSASKPALVEQPRPFGYTVGDLLTQRVLLESDRAAVEPVELPAPGRIGVWFDRRASRIEKRADGRRWLAVEYQVVNAPPALTTIRLPAWQLKTKSPGLTLQIAAWSISVGPLTLENPAAESSPTAEATEEPTLSDTLQAVQQGAANLRADRAAPRVPIEPIRRSVVFWSVALAVTLAAWLAWLLWRNYRTASSQPFARAFLEMRGADESAPQAWQALHRAFDRTAGRVVRPDSLRDLFARAPQLVPLRDRIEQFFTQSSERFYGDGTLTSPISVRALANDLRRVEKRYER